MTTSDIINLCLTIVTIIIATIALLQTQKQTKLSNKQHLFDRRLENYLLFKDLLSLYRSSRSVLDKENIAELVEIPFGCLTNCARLEMVYMLIKSPTDDHLRKVFLTKCEELEHSAEETRLIWDESLGELPALFIKQHVQLLKTLYEQQLMIIAAREDSEGKIIRHEDMQKRLKESAQNGGLMDAINTIAVTFKEIESTCVEIKLAESIKLVK